MTSKLTHQQDKSFVNGKISKVVTELETDRSPTHYLFGFTFEKEAEA